jgi:hypothetical protein
MPPSKLAQLPSPGDSTTSRGFWFLLLVYNFLTLLVGYSLMVESSTFFLIESL